MKYFLDTNIFLRFLQQDEYVKSEKVLKLFESAKNNKIQLIVEIFIIIELAYALKSYFKLTKKEVCEKLNSILDLPYLDIPDRKFITDAVSEYESHGIDFMDALLYVKAKNREGKIFSFDSDFDKLTPNLRLEP